MRKLASADARVGEPASLVDFVLVHETPAFVGADVDAFHIVALATAVSTPGANEYHGFLAVDTVPCRLRTTEKTQEDQNTSFLPCVVQAWQTLDNAKHEKKTFLVVLDAAVVAVVVCLENTFDLAVDFVASAGTVAVSQSVVVSPIDCPHSQSFDTVTVVKRQLLMATSPSTHLLQDLSQLRKSLGPGSS